MRRTTEVLAQEGFGIITQIDVTETFKKKLGIEFRNYRILGACNPNMAHQALGIEPRAGAMLPCNVIVRAVADGVEVSAIDPVASMAAIENDRLKAVAGEVREMLRAVVASI
ncbi:MAG TPA: DUF302 domain-containing protein [Rhodopila sp.]|nr:DUF302 domain-containing protein [Rhodopila sp.]